MKRPEILEAARKCVCGEREEDYGTPENNFKAIGKFWGVYLKSAHPEMKGLGRITAKDVAVMMVLFKTARIATGTGTDDCFVDIAGYAACGGEIMEGNDV